MHNKLAVTGGSRRFFKGKLCLAGLLMLLFWHLLPIQGLAADGRQAGDSCRVSHTVGDDRSG